MRRGDRLRGLDGGQHLTEWVSRLLFHCFELTGASADTCPNCATVRTRIIQQLSLCPAEIQAKANEPLEAKEQTPRVGSTKGRTVVLVVYVSRPVFRRVGEWRDTWAAYREFRGDDSAEGLHRNSPEQSAGIDFAPSEPSILRQDQPATHPRGPYYFVDLTSP